MHPSSHSVTERSLGKQARHGCSQRRQDRGPQCLVVPLLQIEAALMWTEGFFDGLVCHRGRTGLACSERICAKVRSKDTDGKFAVWDKAYVLGACPATDEELCTTAIACIAGERRTGRPFQIGPFHDQEPRQGPLQSRENGGGTLAAGTCFPVADINGKFGEANVLWKPTQSVC